MPGFLAAMHNARAQRPDLPVAAWQAAACTKRDAFSRLRVTPAFIVRWAEFYSFTSMARAACW